MADKQKQKGKPASVPKLFVCPITLEIMQEPTITGCGHMFEREAIHNWIVGGNAVFKVGNKLCPICNQTINENQLAPCYPIKTAIEDWMQNHSLALETDESAGSGSSTANNPPSKGPKIGSSLFSSFSKAKAGMKSAVSNIVGRAKNNNPAVIISINSKEQEIQPSRPSFSQTSPTAAPPPARNRSNSQGAAIQAWARLEPLTRIYEPIDITKDSITFGRSSQCDFVINRAEISGKHCTIYRIMKNPTASDYVEGGFNWDVFLEDLSTNGTYLNGRRQPKNDPTTIKHGDEISMGNRFTSSEKPELNSFIDWVFLGTLKTSPIFTDVAKLKTVIADFDTLLFLKEDDLVSRGIASTEVRQKILLAASSWNDEHQLPVYRLIINWINAPISAPLRPSTASAFRHMNVDSTAIRNDSASAPMLSSGMSYTSFQQASEAKKSSKPVSNLPVPLPPPIVLANSSSSSSSSLSGLPSSLPTTLPPPLGTSAPKLSPTASAATAAPTPAASTAPSVSTSAQVPAPEPEIDEEEFDVGFSPATYMAEVKNKTVSMNLRRIGPVSVPLTVYLSTTNEGTAVPGVDFTPLENVPVTFPVGSMDVEYDFKWDCEADPDGGIITINFAVFRSNGQMMPSTTITEPFAVLIVDKTPKADNQPTIEGLPPNEEMLLKVATVFSDINAATIHSVFYMEKEANSTNRPEDLQDAVVQKLLWYRSLPDETPADLTDYLNNGSSSNSTAEPSASSSNSVTSSSVASTSPAVTSSSVASVPPAVTSSSAPTSNSNRLKQPVPSFEFAAASTVRSSPHQPRAQLADLFSQPNIDLMQNEIEPFVLLSCLNYLKSDRRYEAFLNQNYQPFASHRTAIIAAVCREVYSILSNYLKASGLNKEKEILDRVKSSTDQVMQIFMKTGIDDPSIAKLVSSFFACALSNNLPNKPSVALVIEDFNGLFELAPSHPIQSMYILVETNEQVWSAPFVSRQLIAGMASNETLLQSNVKMALESSFLETQQQLVATNENLAMELRASASLVWIRDASIFACLCGSTTLLLLEGSKGLVNKVKKMQPRPDAMTLLGDPNFDKPEIFQFSLRGDEQFIVLGSQSFFKALPDKEIVRLLNLGAPDIGKLTERLLTQAAANNSAEKISVLLIQFSS